MMTLALAASVGCEPLRPPNIDASAGSGDATAPTPSAFAPPGAELGGTGELVGSTIESWAVLDEARALAELGFTLPLAMVSNLSRARTAVDRFIVVPPEVAKQSIIRTLYLQHSPVGHVPAGVYDDPHWDLHIQTLTEEESRAIDCTEPNTIPVNAPSNFFDTNSCIEKSGYHYFDSTAPEFNQEQFSKWVHLTYYRGALSSYEAKVRTTTLLERQSFDLAIPSLPNPGKPGLVPGSFSAVYVPEADVYVVTLRGFRAPTP